MTARAATPPLAYVHDDDRECLGFVLARGKLGFEAIEREERSVGIYTTQREAAETIMRGKPWAA
jgi:hypothetical protein